MSGWTNIEDEFPHDESRHYLVRVEGDGFRMFYLCGVNPSPWTGEDLMRLEGYSPIGRRFIATERTKKEKEERAADLLLAYGIDDHPRVCWRPVEE